MNIQKNIPIPTSNRIPGGMGSVLVAMTAGDSVVIQSGKHMSWRSVASRLKIKITIRHISDLESRLWRVE